MQPKKNPKNHPESFKKVWNFEPPPKKKHQNQTPRDPETPTARDRRSASGNLEGLNIGRRSRRKRPPVAHPRHRGKTDVDEFVAPKSTHRLP